MPRTLMLATDLGHRSDRALDRAATLARAWQARLLIVHVLEGGTQRRADLPSWRRVSDPLAEARRRVQRDLGATQDLALEVIVERGDPDTLIADLAAQYQVDLLVCGVARDEALGRLLLGSTVEGLVKRLPAPLLVVKRRPHGDYRGLVVASDFTPSARAAAAVAAAWWPQAQLDLFHAFSLPFEGLLDDKTRAIEQARRRAMDECRRYLEDAPEVRYANTYCEHGDPAVLLSDLVEAREVDLVVVGTEGRRGLAGMVLGSVAQRVLDRVPVDVLVAPRVDA